MFDPKVVTNYADGTIISMDANDALNFIVGLSITVINTIRNTVREVGYNTEIVNRDPDIMHLIKHYNSGVQGAIYSCILQTNAAILFSFVRDITLNQSTRGLYLFYHRAKGANVEAPYDLVVRALEEAHQHYMTYGSDNYKKDSSKHLNRYNEDFMKLIHAE